MKPVTMTAAYVVSIPSTADAERALRQSDYHPPDAEFDKLPLTDSIADAEEEAEAEPEPEEDAAPESDAADGDRRSDERRVGKEGVREGSSGWVPSYYKKHKNTKIQG